LASAASTLELHTAILATVEAAPDVYVADLLETRQDTLPATIEPLPIRQSSWDQPLIQKDKLEVSGSAVDFVNKARLVAVSSPHSADWLTALPIAACGLALDNEAVRVAVGLRLGLVRFPHVPLWRWSWPGGPPWLRV
jgi:hypothetical protein